MVRIKRVQRRPGLSRIMQRKHTLSKAVSEVDKKRMQQLMQFSLRRHDFLHKLQGILNSIKADINNGVTKLPYYISIVVVGLNEKWNFRVWNHESWIKRNTMDIDNKNSEDLENVKDFFPKDLIFLEFLGTSPVTTQQENKDTGPILNQPPVFLLADISKHDSLDSNSPTNVEELIDEIMDLLIRFAEVLKRGT